LGFLTTEQALADYAQFIDYIKESIPNAKKSPVIVFGGSYGGLRKYKIGFEIILKEILSLYIYL
jgi:surfactin synthase thioesterase subunit